MTGTNVSLFAIAAALVGGGASVIGTNLLQGAIEIILGVIVIIVYEKLPPSTV